VAGDPKEVSPVFTQFIDCTWQLAQHFPATFQFNERFLLILHDHVQSCQFGTFIGNCEKDRVDLRYVCMSIAVMLDFAHCLRFMTYYTLLW
jgi:myotubularin-related protein 6/7/8